MDDAVRASVHRASALSAGIAAVLSPIPLADEIVLIPVYGMMTWRIGRSHGLGIGGIPWRPVTSTAVAGLAARAVLNLAFALVPGVAAVSNAVSAVALTELLGGYIDTACQDPAAARPWKIADFATALRGRTAPAATVTSP